MVLNNSFQAQLGDLMDSPVKSLSYFVTAFLAIVFIFSLQGPNKPNAPLLNPKGAFELTESRPRKQYTDGLRNMLGAWFRANSNKAATVVSDVGYMTVLPPSMANEVRSDSRLSFTAFSVKFFHARIPGFEAFNEGTRDSITLTVINKDLTKHLAKITAPLADETKLALEKTFGNSTEWKTLPLRESLLYVISRISSRVFLGEELCRNEEWLKITREHVMEGFMAGDELRTWPYWLQPLVHWFMPRCQTMRSQIKRAEALMGPVIQKRRAEAAAAMAAGKKPPVYNDAIEWFELASKGTHYNPALSQLFLSTVAMHTTSDLLCQAMTDIAQHPEIFDELRQEIKQVLGQGGWKKTSLYEMKLLDSVLKESQRLKPLQLASMQRIATDDVVLSDGTFIPKGTVTCVSSHNLWDANVYEDPEKWDGHRFLRQRQMTGKENVSQLVSTSENHLGFGHGKHACPGRFFAANELKIALAHLLLQYDWRLLEGDKPYVFDVGVTPLMNPGLRVEMRRRTDDFEVPAIDLD